MPSNPKYPGLTAHKMHGLWSRVRHQRDKSSDLQDELRGHRRDFRLFRDKWGSRPPRSEAHWLNFWREFFALEDTITDIEESLAKIQAQLGKLSERGLEITRLNGYQLSDAATIQSLKQMLIELEDMFTEIGQVDDSEENG